MTTAVILQSSYIPWKGYFDLINDADVFVFLDDVQFTAGDWRNRNKIKTQGGTQWLTIPVIHDFGCSIDEVVINDTKWQIKHWKSISQNYSKAPYFNSFKGFFESVYLDHKWIGLAEFNRYLIKAISHDFLGINTKFCHSLDFCKDGQKTERLLEILKNIGAKTYLSGPAAKCYIDQKKFVQAGIELVWKEYSGYPCYPQFHPPFAHNVSIIDLLFNMGPEAAWYIWGWRKDIDFSN